MIEPCYGDQPKNNSSLKVDGNEKLGGKGRRQ